MAEQRFADLKSSQRFERGWNGLQTLVEILVCVVVFAALAGLFGTGPLSSRMVRFDKAPLTMSYERIQRRTVQSEIQLVTTAPLGSDSLEVEIPNQLTKDIDIVSTSPRSVSMRAEAGGIVYVFALGTARLGTITFSIKPRKPGLIDSVVKAGAGEAQLRQIVLP